MSRPLSSKQLYRKRNAIKKKLLSIVLSMVIALFILSFSIACPILIRPVYYAMTDSLHLPELTGYSRETIIEAYDDMMDYCTRGGEQAGQIFRTGSLSWTEDGKDHFDDVERMFRLDFTVLGITGGLLALWLFLKLFLRLRKRPGPEPHRFLGLGPLFWGPSVLLGIFAALTIAAVTDFDGFFVWFHHMLFPGKENWLLDIGTDEIVNILPYEVLQTFGFIIVGLLLAGCAVCIVSDIVYYRKKKRIR